MSIDLQDFVRHAASAIGEKTLVIAATASTEPDGRLASDARSSGHGDACEQLVLIARITAFVTVLAERTLDMAVSMARAETPEKSEEEIRETLTAWFDDSLRQFMEHAAAHGGTLIARNKD